MQLRNQLFPVSLGTTSAPVVMVIVGTNSSGGSNCRRDIAIRDPESLGIFPVPCDRGTLTAKSRLFLRRF